MTQVPDPNFFERIRLAGNPQADPGAIVVRDHARFTVLTPRLIRMEWTAAGVFEDRATFAFPNRAAPAPEFQVEHADGALTIDTGALRLSYRPDGAPFSESNLSVTLQLNGEDITWVPGTAPAGNLRGTRRTLDDTAGPVTLSEGLLSRDGWAVHDDSSAILFTEGGRWVAPRPGHDLQDWYFFGYGHDYTGALSEYTRFGGQILLIPRFVLGAWWSKFWDYSAKDLEQLADDFRAHDLPLDVLVVDMDWHTPESWTGYTWNRELFPDPEGFLRGMHERGLRITLNLHPAEGVQPFEEAYPRFAEALGLDPAGRIPVPFQPGNPAFMQYYFEMLHHPMEDQGVDFWWIDWQQGEASDIPGLDPLLWLNHLHFLDSMRRGGRPMLYSRWGGLGNHRYHIGFSGDTHGVWPALASLPHFTAAASNVLYGWWSHDIGGHFGANTPELFARWVQFGALSPCLRLHSTKDPNAERRPWTFPRPVFEAARDAFHLRYALVPYLYTMARTAMDTGIPLCRPLYYAYPESEPAYLARDQYFLGDRILAAPIVRPADPDAGTGMASVDAWVPDGTWIDYQTQETFTGPRWVRLVGDIARMPLLVPPGAILPLARPAAMTGSIPAGDLIIEVFPGEEGSFRLYEDDGVSLAYLEGQHEWTPVTMRTEGESTCRLAIGPAEGRCDTLPTERSYEIRFRTTNRPNRVLVDGQEGAEWTYDAETQTTVARVPRTPRHSKVEVVVAAEGRISALSEEHNHRCVERDVRRLLGDSFPPVAWDDLPGAVLRQVESPGRADAVARLGGPFAFIMEYVTLPEATEHLGAVALAAPADGSPFDCTVTWTLHDSAGEHAHTDTITGAREDRVVRSPFAFDGPLQPLYWEVDVTISWRGATLFYSHRSEVISPAIPVWRAALTDQELVAAPDGFAVPAGAIVEWEEHRADPTTQASLSVPFQVRLDRKYKDLLEAEAGHKAYGIATITAGSEREVRLAYDVPGAFAMWLNGDPVPDAPPGEDSAVSRLPALRLPHISVPVRLRKGENTLLVRAEPAPVRHWLSFEVVVREADGEPATGLRFDAGPPGPKQAPGAA